MRFVDRACISFSQSVSKWVSQLVCTLFIFIEHEIAYALPCHKSTTITTTTIADRLNGKSKIHKLFKFQAICIPYMVAVTSRCKYGFCTFAASAHFLSSLSIIYHAYLVHVKSIYSSCSSRLCVHRCYLAIFVWWIFWIHGPSLYNHSSLFSLSRKFIENRHSHFVFFTLSHSADSIDHTIRIMSFSFQAKDVLPLLTYWFYSKTVPKIRNAIEPFVVIVVAIVDVYAEKKRLNWTMENLIKFNVPVAACFMPIKINFSFAAHRFTSWNAQQWQTPFMQISIFIPY